MDAVLSRLIERLGSAPCSDMKIIPWSSPVPSFGDLSRARVATVGLNPSNLEFVDKAGNELAEGHRRFHTLDSLGLTSWSDVTPESLRSIWDSCRTYFSNKPYDRWFRRLDDLIGGTNSSYYGASANACHLDLVPIATECKWRELSQTQRSSLFSIAADTLGHLLRESSIQLLILNGASVVDYFQKLAGIHLEKREMSEWTLRRNVVGNAFKGVATDLFGVKLERRLLVIGFNHNIPRSPIPREVIASMRQWIKRQADEAFS